MGRTASTTAGSGAALAAAADTLTTARGDGGVEPAADEQRRAAAAWRAVPAAPPAAFERCLARFEAAYSDELGGAPPMLGYPTNLHALGALSAARARLAPHVRLTTCGDPFSSDKHKMGAYRLHTLETEHALVQELARPWLSKDDREKMDGSSSAGAQNARNAADAGAAGGKVPARGQHGEEGDAAGGSTGVEDGCPSEFPVPPPPQRSTKRLRAEHMQASAHSAPQTTEDCDEGSAPVLALSLSPTKKKPRADPSMSCDATTVTAQHAPAVPRVLLEGAPASSAAPGTQCAAAANDGAAKASGPRTHSTWTERGTRGPEGDWWGHLTTGGTEGVMRGVLAGLRRFGLDSTDGQLTLMLWSEEAHYCVPKAANMLGARLRASVEADENGAMDMRSLEQVVGVARRSMDISRFVVVCTLGTTFRGASDDVRGVLRVLHAVGIEREHVHIHVDAALAGGYWPLDEHAPKYVLGEDFDSISISAHKWWGGVVGGVVLLSAAACSAQAESGAYVPYLQITDRMISGCRDGLIAPLWQARMRQLEWGDEYARCVGLCEIFEAALGKSRVPHARQPHSLIIVFPRPSERTVELFQLATVDDEAHVVVLPHATEEALLWLAELVARNYHATRAHTVMAAEA